MTLVDVDLGLTSNNDRLTSPLIGCEGVRTVLVFFTIVLQFYTEDEKQKKKYSMITSLNGESFC